MVRPNKTKPEGYMRPLTVPGGYSHALHCSRTRRSWVRIPPGPPVFLPGFARRRRCRRSCPLRGDAELAAPSNEPGRLRVCRILWSLCCRWVAPRRFSVLCYAVHRDWRV